MYGQINLYLCHTFESFIPCLTIFLGEVTAHISLNVPTNGSLIVKKLEKLSF